MAQSYVGKRAISKRDRRAIRKFVVCSASPCSCAAAASVRVLSMDGRDRRHLHAAAVIFFRGRRQAEIASRSFTAGNKIAP
jgi:hypothetical protein